MLVHQDVEPSGVTVLALSGDFLYEQVAQRVHQSHVRHVLILQDSGNRLTELGIVPTLDQIGVRELRKRDVAESQIEILQNLSGSGPWGAIRALDKWLTSHESEQVIIYCDHFSSQRISLLSDWLLPASIRTRVRVRSLPDRRFDETNWWKSRQGVKAWFNQLTILFFEGLFGEGSPRKRPMDSDTYEALVFE